MKQPSVRDIPTDNERRAVREIANQAAQLEPERRAALRDDLHELAAREATPALLTLAEISTEFRVSVRTLLRHIERGDLEALRIGRAYQVTRAQLEAWIQRRTIRRTRTA